MRFEGTLTTWNDEGGFGRIEPTQSGEPVFVQVSTWPRGSNRLHIGQLVAFEVDLDPKGKRAMTIQLAQARRPANRHERPRARCMRWLSLAGGLAHCWLSSGCVTRPPSKHSGRSSGPASC